MKSIILTKTGLNKVRAHHKELKVSDIDGSIKSLTPGEWCFMFHPPETQGWIGFVNPLVDEKMACVHILCSTSLKESETFQPETYVSTMIENSVNRRHRFQGYAEGSRLFYGAADGLPGLIIDGFRDVAIIQINTAGVDRYREAISSSVLASTKKKPFFLDNQKYREKEFLPVFANPELPAIDIIESDLKFKMRPEVMQKVGFYYDHRENRRQLRDILEKLNLKFERALDLFCYAGAWGVSALKGRVERAEFVDQGDFETEVKMTLELNGMSGKGSFHRNDVFKFLDQSIAQKNSFDVILCDPPAFAKSINQKDQALEGYSKLHRKVFKIASQRSLIVFSSCTHYVTHEEFQKNILEAANKENRKIQLVHTGMQGWDHPVKSLSERANYIKSYFYITE